eukprot:GHVS01047941.1.p1 GENE.GHVS01047941.1~~GHVS01047941.1.p1  ORF type:complete len:351 (+),score=89.08 GHVS01047941.1:152-1204(+)
MLFRSSFSVVCVVAVAALLAPASVDGAKKKKPSAPHKVPIKQGDVTYECPHGYELQGKHECVKILSAEMQPVCPHGTMLKADECVEKTDLIYKCPAGYATTSDKTSHNHHSSSHNRNHGGKKDDHHVESHHGKKRRSLEESAVSRQLKKKKDDKDDKKPFGKKGAHEVCERTIYEEPHYKCPFDAVRQQYGSSSHGEKKKETSCYKPVSVALLQDCGHGVYDGSSGKCVEHSITESLQSCPALYELCGQKGGRKLYGKETEESKGKVEAPPSCCRMEFAIPQPVCHHGYTQQAHHCVRSSEPKMKCPHGYVSNNGSCTQELRKKPVQLYSVVMCKGKHCEAHGEKKHLRQ